MQQSILNQRRTGYSLLPNDQMKEMTCGDWVQRTRNLYELLDQQFSLRVYSRSIATELLSCHPISRKISFVTI